LQAQDAADLTQDVLLKLIQVLPTFEYDAYKGFRRWLRTVTLNTWRDRRKHRADRPLPGNEEVLAKAMAPEAQEAFWNHDSRLQLVNRAIALMKTDFQETTWKAFWEQVVAGRRARDVAAELRISTGAAHAAKFRVLNRLRLELDGMLD
jgi:RNA polymerase sigma-70 factor (ECF subfamily)